MTKPELDTDSWMSSNEGHPRRWSILAVLVVSLLVVVLDNTILNIALPTIQRELDATQGQLVWSVDSYILVFAALLFTWGVLGDRYGRKRILVIGLVIFSGASAACAYSSSPEMLIAFRAVMGVGGAAVLPTTLAIITVVFPPHERGKAIGAWAGAVGAAVVLGPVLGGALLKYPEIFEPITGNEWGSVFLVNVPIVAVGLFAIWRVVPETRNSHPGKVDAFGVLLSITGLATLVYGIIHASETRNWLDPVVVGCIVIGVAIIGIFIVLEYRSDHPSFDVTLFRNRGYAVTIAAVSMAFFALSGMTFALPFYLQILRGFDTLVAGLCFVPFAAGQLISAPRSATSVARFGFRAVMTFGLIVVAVSLAGLVFIEQDTPIWMLLVGFFLFGLGMGNVIAPASTLMQNVLPLARAGAGSAVQNTARQVGGALGVAISGTVLATHYAGALTSNPALVDSTGVGVPAELVERMSESVVATSAIIQQGPAFGIPENTLAAIETAAFSSFLSAAHVTLAISAAVVALAAILVAFAFPSVAVPQDPRSGHQLKDESPISRRIHEKETHYRDELGQELGVVGADHDSDAKD